jgi:hypothetical protein
MTDKEIISKCKRQTNHELLVATCGCGEKVVSISGLLEEARQDERSKFLKIIDKWIDAGENGAVNLDYVTLSFIRQSVEELT